MAEAARSYLDAHAHLRDASDALEVLADSLKRAADCMPNVKPSDRAVIGRLNTMSLRAKPSIEYMHSIVEASKLLAELEAQRE